MSVTPVRNFTRLAAAIVAAAVVIGTAIFASPYLGMATRQTVTETETSTTTATLTPSAEIEPNGSLLLSKTVSPWVYDVLVNSTSASVGGALLVFGDLTYSGLANVTIDEADPLNGLEVFNSTGGLVWEYTPSSINFDATITPGETLGGPICIPVTTTPPAPSGQNHDCQFAFRQPVPGLYSIEVAPIFYSVPSHQDLGDNLQITANFTIF
jgi:hypothetical protein